MSFDARHHTTRLHRLRKKDASAIRRLKGPTPGVSVPCVLALVGCQWCAWVWVSMAWTEPSDILFMFMLSWLNANTLMYALGTFIHENSHGLVMGSGRRVWAAALIEIGLLSFGEQWEYTYVHATRHHPHLNDPRKDSECPTPRGHVAGRGNVVWESAVELLPGGIFFTAGNLSNNAQTSNTRIPWKPRVGLALMSIAMHSFMLWRGMWPGCLLSVWSLSLCSSRWCISLHGQSIAEHRKHDRTPKTVPTWSTYHVIENVIGFNTGYHDEHHTVPDVAWHRLPALRATFPDEFTNAQPDRYATLWWHWMVSGFSLAGFRSCDAGDAHDGGAEQAYHMPASTMIDWRNSRTACKENTRVSISKRLSSRRYPHSSPLKSVRCSRDTTRSPVFLRASSVAKAIDAWCV